MEGKMKKLLMCLLAICFLLTMIPMTAMAESDNAVAITGLVLVALVGIGAVFIWHQGGKTPVVTEKETSHWDIGLIGYNTICPDDARIEPTLGFTLTW